jgi:cysteinyl-tRNA synthetase
VFPHHENEIAQSRRAFHTGAMANFWMHNGFLQVEGEKMSKSLGNFVTIHELLKDWPGEVVRFNMLRAHYRQPIDWTVKGLEESNKILDGWYQAISDIEPACEPDPIFLNALGDDLNTPAAIHRLHQLAHPHVGGRAMAGFTASDASRFLKSSAMTIGLLTQSASERRSAILKFSQIDIAAVETLVAARTVARKAKNFAESDRIRDELAAMGVVLKDSKDETTWEPAR